MTTDATTATQVGSATRLNRPKPRASARSARPTVVAGNRMRTSTMLSSTMPRLLGPPPPPPEGLAPPRRHQLPSRHDDEHAAECGEADIDLVVEQGVAHGLANAPSYLTIFLNSLSFNHSLE